MIFQPRNEHIEIAPLEAQSIIVSRDATYEEKGIIMSVAPGFEAYNLIGKCAYFDSWQAAKFSDSEGKTRWLVPWGAIRAIEYESLPTK